MLERKIDLFDLLIETLLRWRMILVWMLVFGILLGGYSYINSVHAIQSTEVIDADELELQPTEAQKNKVNNVIYLEQSHKEYLDYVSKSPMMKINAAAAPCIDLIVGIKTEEVATAQNVKDAYIQLASSSEIYAYLGEHCEGLSTEDVSELIKVYGKSGQMDGNAYGGILDESLGQVLCVRVFAPDKPACRQLAEMVWKYMESFSLKDVFGQYELILLSDAYAEIVDADLIGRQDDMRLHISTLQSDYEEAKSNLTEEEMQYYENLISETETETVDDTESDSSASAEPATAQVSLKYVFMGLLIGAFFYILVFAIRYIVSDKLRYCDDIAQMYHIPLLARMPQDKSFQGIFGFIDRWLWNLKAKEKHPLTKEERIHMAAFTVKTEALKRNYTAVYCIEGTHSQETECASQSFANELKENGLSVQCLKNILYDIEAQEKLQQADAVVLVEKTGVSVWQEIREELEMLKSRNVAVLGSIIVG